MSAEKYHTFLIAFCEVWQHRKLASSEDTAFLEDSLLSKTMLDALGVEASLHLDVQTFPWQLNDRTWERGFDNTTAQAFHQVLQNAQVRSLTFLPSTTTSDILKLIDMLVPIATQERTAETELPPLLTLRVEMGRPEAPVASLSVTPSIEANSFQLSTQAKAEELFFDHEPTRPGVTEPESLDEDFPFPVVKESVKPSTKKTEPVKETSEEPWPSVVQTSPQKESVAPTPEHSTDPAEISLQAESYGHLTNLFTTMDNEQLYDHFLSETGWNQLHWDQLEENSDANYSPTSDEFHTQMSLEEQCAEYVQQLLSSQYAQGVRIQAGEREATESVKSRVGLQETLWIHEQLRTYLAQFSDTVQHQTLLPTVAEQMLRLDPILLMEHFEALQSHPTFQEAILQAMFEQGDEDRLWALVQHLLRYVESLVSPEQFRLSSQLVHTYVEAAYQRNWEHKLILLLQNLGRGPHRPTSPVLQSWYHSILSTVGLPKYLTALFASARQDNDVASSQLLGLLFPLSLWHGIRELDSLKHPLLRTRHIDVLHRLGKPIPVPLLHTTLSQALDKISSLSLGSQQCLLALVRWYHPGLLEEFLVQRLPYVKDSGLRQVLLEQAIALNTTFTKQLLLHLLRGLALARDPQQEEMILLVLHHERVLDGTQLLHQRIFQSSLDIGIRCNAVWMLGALPCATTFKMAQALLCDPMPPNENPVEWEALRFQTLFTLQRFPYSVTESLLQQGKLSSSLLHQMGSRVLLRDALPNDFRSLYEETEQLRQARQ